MFMHGNMKSAI